jgi:hypothetical protein
MYEQQNSNSVACPETFNSSINYMYDTDHPPESIPSPTNPSVPGNR